MPEPMKLVKLEIRFKCPNPECGVGAATNGAECLRCVLMNIYGDQTVYEEVHRDRRVEDDTIDISQSTIPDVVQTMDTTDLDFLASPATILMAQREWEGPDLAKALELHRGKPTTYEAPIVDLTVVPDSKADGK